MEEKLNKLIEAYELRLKEVNKDIRDMNNLVIDYDDDDMAECYIERSYIKTFLKNLKSLKE